ncbi:TRAP transporter small permease [Pelotomaculum isophthalicicum JI]|uniref:TRAP transporter small permease n=1 Tax=Pelotomaculum isophthalicicum JI TaxID=947010 RepID=A0A9X4JVQ2_9FIRM|nr:TRAP transporter small permease [Pelotomaculum isophthalicicum]MDF9407797.1 TRAP transporter small permease [Pelotomaculum isophthalicicum JI]
MKKFEGLVTGLSRVLNNIAGFCMVSVMALVVVNILLRVLFKHPILGTYEYVIYTTAVMIGLTLAYCAVQNGHIAVDFVVERLPLKVQAVIDTIMNVLASSFWAACVWQTCKYAQKMTANGTVSPTTQTPIAPFIYLVAIGLLALTLVLLVKTIESLKKAFSLSDISMPAPNVGAVESIQKAVTH